MPEILSAPRNNIRSKTARSLYAIEWLEPRLLLSNSIQIQNTDFSFEQGQPYTLVGRLVDSSGSPIAGASHAN